MSSYIEVQLGSSEGRNDPQTVAPKVRIEVPFDDLNLENVWECLIKPALLGAGYMEKTIEGLFKEAKSDF